MPWSGDTRPAMTLSFFLSWWELQRGKCLLTFFNHILCCLVIIVYIWGVCVCMCGWNTVKGFLLLNTGPNHLNQPPKSTLSVDRWMDRSGFEVPSQHLFVHLISVEFNTVTSFEEWLSECCAIIHLFKWLLLPAPLHDYWRHRKKHKPVIFWHNSALWDTLSREEAPQWALSRSQRWILCGSLCSFDRASFIDWILDLSPSPGRVLVSYISG